MNEITGRYGSEELIGLLKGIGVPVSKIKTIPEVIADPMVKRKLLFTKDPVTNTRVTLAPPPHMTRFLEKNDRHLSFPPRFGEQNQEIFGEMLGYSDKMLSEFRQKGVI